jgi:hypothetical protein
MSPAAGQSPSALTIPPVVLRVIASLVVGGLTLLVTSATGQSRESTLILSVFIAGVVLVVQYLTLFERKLDRSEERLTQHEAVVDGMLNKVTRAARLFTRIEDSPIDPTNIERLVDNLRTLKADAPDLISGLAVSEFERLTKFIENLGSGEAKYKGEDREWLLTLTRTVKTEILATSSPEVDGNFWDTEFAAEYSDAQTEAVARDVKIRRVFMVSGRQISDLALADLRRQQAQLNFEVRFVDTDKLTKNQLTRIDNFVVFDRQLYYHLQPPLKSDSGSTVVQTRLSRWADDVDAAVTRFEQWWALGE